MGFFSWKTQDTGKSISNSSSTNETFTVYLHDNKGNKWKEDYYEGYGEFGGKDFYSLLDEMNGGNGDRNKGINIAFSGKQILWPNITENKNHSWSNIRPTECEYQGFFY